MFGEAESEIVRPLQNRECDFPVGRRRATALRVSLPGVGHNLGLIKQESGRKVVLMLAGQYAAAR